MNLLRAFARFWYDFLVGDDWKIAAAVATVLAGGATFVVAGFATSTVLAPLVGGALVGAFVVAVLLDVRSR